jgi:thiosulfate/3-mercaptopyruvate sulfurtransferase
MRIRTSVAFLVVTLSAFWALPASAQSSPAQSATTIPAPQLIQPADLNTLLASGDQSKLPLILQVGSHVFFAQAHITGSQYAGPGSQEAGLALLEKAVSSLPKDKFIVIYCGCCPWNRCPNVGPAFKRLCELGYTNVKVLYLANNFGDDWVSKGYPTQK